MKIILYFNSKMLYNCFMMIKKETEMTPWEQMSRKDQLAATHYDFYKSVHGVRPRWFNYDEMSEQELEAEMESLSKEAEVVFAQEAKAEAEAIVVFEARVSDLIASGAENRETAIRWIHEAEGSDGDSDYLCFLVGVPYGYLG
jgi:hypothetical protein